MEELLNVDSLEIGLPGRKQALKIVNKISFSLKHGETLGVVGESGCGKSITALSIMGLLGKNIKILNGSITFKKQEISSYSDREIRKLCGRDIGMIFQEPMTALNPMFTIGKQLSDAQRLHLGLTKEEAYKNSIKLLEMVGISKAGDVLDSYPHEFSGGMRQRVLIAMAISCNPSLVIADEPTTALDVITQRQILRIIKNLIKDRDMSMLLISHDLSVISEMADRIIVMYSGEIIETDTAYNIIKNPSHPYTKSLVQAARELANSSKEELSVTEGSVPRPEEKIIGCKFAARCKSCMDVCKREKPVFKSKFGGAGSVLCWLDFEVGE